MQNWLSFFNFNYFFKGAGFGGFFKGLLNFMRPIVKSPIVQEIGKEAVKTGIKIGGEVLSGRNFKESASENLKEAKNRVMDSINPAAPFADNSEDEEWLSPPFKKARRSKVTKKSTPKISSKKKKKTVLG